MCAAKLLRRVIRRMIPLVLLLVASQATASSDLLAWRDAKTLDSVVGHLEEWLDQSAPWPAKPSRPVIRQISAAEAASLHTPLFSGSGKPRGLYDPETSTIYLVRPWDQRDPRDVSVLLHELVHHRQHGAQHWYCPSAMELPAYRLQDEWLRQLGLEAEVNWIAVVLEGGCRVTDFHPD